MPSTVHIRDAAKHDAAAIASLGAETFTASFAHTMTAEDLVVFLSEAYTPEAITKDMSSDQAHFFVATLDNDPSASSEVVGFLQVKFGTTDDCLPKDMDPVEINRIYVAKSHLSQGVGRVLMQHALDWLQQNPYGGRRLLAKPAEGKRYGVFLGVWENNHASQRFYSRFGFERVGEHGFKTGNTITTDWVMSKWM